MCCEDIVGYRDFSNHLVSKHVTSFKEHIANYEMKTVVLRKNFHFCKMCFKNINHDEDDLKKHFRKDHGISVSNYYDKYKGQLKNPKLQRPSGRSSQEELQEKEVEKKKRSASPEVPNKRIRCSEAASLSTCSIRDKVNISSNLSYNKHVLGCKMSSKISPNHTSGKQKESFGLREMKKHDLTNRNENGHLDPV